MLHPSLVSCGVGAAPLRLGVLVAATLCALLCGSNYLFASIALPLSNALGGRSVSVLGSSIDLGVYTGLLISAFYSRAGTRWTALLGGALAAGGYLALALLVPMQLATSVYGAAFFAIGQGSYGLFSICLTTACRNQALSDRGKVTGAMVASYGFCSLVMTAVFQHALGANLIHFFYAMSLLLVAATVIILLLVEVVPSDEAASKAALVASASPFASVAAVVPVGEASERLLTHHYAAVSNEGAKHNDVESQDSHDHGADEGGHRDDGATGVSSLLCNPYVDRDGHSTVLTPSAEGGSSTTLADESVAYILRSLEFWLLWAAFFFLAGAALAWKNSLGALVQHMATAGQLPPLNAASKPADVNAFVSSASSAWALVNACARIVGGFAIDATRRAVARRPLWIALSALFVGGGMVPLAYAASFGPSGSAASPSDLSLAFWAANFGNACSYGLAWAICATLLSLLFGITSLSRNYGILLLSLAAGGFVFTQLGTDAETGGGTSGGGAGDGVSVFAVSLWAAVGAATVALAPSLWLAARYRVFISPSSGATGLPLNARRTAAVRGESPSSIQSTNAMLR